MKRKKYHFSSIDFLLSLLFLSSLTIFASCEERPIEIDASLSVGNILLTDNSIISPQGYDKKTQVAAGVIFYANKDTVIVVGTKELGAYIYSDSIGTVANVTNDIYKLCGTENMAAIMASEFHSPAVEAVKKYPSPISGWVLPSTGELKALSRNIQIVKNTMKIIGGDEFSKEQYLSSSQDGSSVKSGEMFYYGVSLENGFITSINKKTASRVRPIIRLQ